MRWRGWLIHTSITYAANWKSGVSGVLTSVRGSVTGICSHEKRVPFIMALDLRQGVVAGGRQCRAYRPVHVAAFCPAGCTGTASGCRRRYDRNFCICGKILILIASVTAHEIIDDWYGLQFSDPSIASTDWLTLEGWSRL